MKVKFNLPVQRFNSKISFDNNTTLGIGNLQPLFCKFVLPKSKFNCNLAQLTRLSPLVVPYFAYPNSLSALTQITDENGFDVTSSWTSRSVVITNTHGQSATYRVYEFNNPAGSANSTFYTFKR